MTRPVDRFLMRACPALAVIGVVWGVLELTIGNDVRAALYQFFLSVAMVLCGLASRARMRRNVPPG